MRHWTIKTGRRANGFALITALIFLVLLTLVALIAIRGTGLELKMSSNNGLHQQAFQSSEVARQAIGELIDAHVSAGGWPVTYPGCSSGSPNCVPLAVYGPAPATMFSLRGTDNRFGGSSPPDSWYDHNDASKAGETVKFNPADLTVDATFRENVATSPSTPYYVVANVAVYKLSVGPLAGCNQSANSGGEGVGGGIQGGCSAMWFYLQSSGEDSNSTGAAFLTSAIYRHVNF